MKISEAIMRLKELQEQCGDVDVITDCVFCGRETKPTTVVPEPIKAKLK